MTISIGFDEFNAKIARGGRRSGELLKSNFPPVNFFEDFIFISSSLMITFTPIFSKISIKTSSPCGKFPIFPLTVISSPLSTAAERSSARLEKSIGTVNVALLYICGNMLYFLYGISVCTDTPNFLIVAIVASRYGLETKFPSMVKLIPFSVSGAQINSAEMN